MNLLKTLLLCLLTLSSPLLAYPKGKIDAGATALEVQVFLDGEKVETTNYYGINSTATLALLYGVCGNDSLLDGIVLKPRALGAWNGGSYIWNTALGIGYYIPIGDFSVTPLVGEFYGELSTHAPAAILRPDVFGPDVPQHSKSYGTYIGIDLSYTLCDWMFSLSYQYAWTHTKTHYNTPTNPFFFPTNTFHDHSSGSSIAGQIDYYINDCWSINLAAAYNESLTHEKHGLKIYGVRLGMGYTF